MKTLARYLRSFIDFVGPAGLQDLAIVFLGAAVEGIGLFALLPLLDLVVNDAPTGQARTFVGALNAIGLDDRREQILAVLSGFVLLVAVRGTVQTIRARRLAAISQGFVDHWRMLIFEKLHRADWATLSRMRHHEVHHAVTADVNRLAAGTEQVLRGVAVLVLVVVQVAVAALIAPLLSLLALICLVVLAIVASPYFLRGARQHGERQTRFGRGLHDTLGRYLSGLKLAKVHGYQGYLSSLAATTARLRQETIDYQQNQAAVIAKIQVALATLICLVVAVGLIVLQVPYANLIAFILILIRTSAPIMQLIQSARSVANLLPAFENLEQLQEALGTGEPLIGQQEPIEPHPHAAVGFSFDHVGFAYAGSSHPVLRDVTLEVAGGSFVVLTGRSGIGKTTLLDLLAGLMQPTTGVIRIDGASLADLQTRNQLQRVIAYAPQAPVLFDTTLRENLAWGLPPQTDDAMWSALRLAEAEDIARALPHGLSTRLGEGGALISGGEKQRICLASRLLRNPGLLILDEALSAIDQETAGAILNNLQTSRDKMTIVLVTHRAVEARHFDQVWHIGKNGSVTLGHGAKD